MVGRTETFMFLHFSILCSNIGHSSDRSLLCQQRLVRGCPSASLIDEEINFTTSEWKAIESIIQILKPIETIVLQLCSRNSNLLEADVTTDGPF